ncbi:hypothetical protein E0Z10_g5210 [Xylaria hypoxylon]|uniref:SnoaL-like domain-containing protein n=1 Tax=Xylaria hypoxylon TaxID=37992 RepID=A0A4Z0YUD2_9PEZI|nr:hypothetical protein E0Z10_g5210 [Xylaria hypoxylon]
MSSDSSSSLRATISATTRGFIYSCLNGNSVLGGPKSINSNLTPDCKHYMLPRSFPIAMESPGPDQPSPSPAVETPFTDDPKVCTIQTAVSSLTIDEVARRSAARSVHAIRFISGEEMTLEYAWFFHLVDDGSGIKRIEQFSEEGTRNMHDTRQELIRQVKASGPPSQ